ncbi:hypothetical protein M3J09_001475 [Ascochyta lentis]
MSYVPLGDGRTKPYVETIELTTKHNGQPTYSYVPPSRLPEGEIDNYNNFQEHILSGKPSIDNWPVKSQQVAILTPLRGSILVFDILLASSPLLFTVLAVAVARLDGKVPLTGSYKLEEMLLYTPTVFPLLFAALMGRFFRHLGIWLAERGTTLGRLEQLIGCQSVFLAIERQICLRNFSTVGVCSILIWLLSPFGGQSALRVLRQEARYLNTTQTLHYLDPLNTDNSSMMGASAINSGRSTFTSLFLAALLSSTDYQTRPADLWGNVKLPSYRALQNSNSNDWKPVPDYNETTIKWGSLIGIPVSAFNGEDFTMYATSHFNIKARQFDISCTSNEEKHRDVTSNKTWPIKSTWIVRTAIQQPDCTGNSSCKYVGCDAYPCPIISTSLSESTVYEAASVAKCEYHYDYVEASIECTRSLCKATSMRKLDMFTDGYTEDQDSFIRGVVMANLMVTMPSVDTVGVTSANVRGASNMERWLMDPTSFIGGGGNTVNLHELAVDVFADRLTILWNSFFQATYAARALAGNLDKATSTNIFNSSSGQAISFNATEGLASQRVDVYRVDWKWFAVLLSCSLVLLFAAYAGLVLKYLSVAPDIIGYASSLTMLNPYVPSPTGGTTLHGLERTALLHDLPVRIGDVCPSEPVGAIALAANDGRVVGLDRRRRYI